MNCLIDEPSSSFECTDDGAELKHDEVCTAEYNAVDTCLFGAGGAGNSHMFVCDGGMTEVSQNGVCDGGSNEAGRWNGASPVRTTGSDSNTVSAPRERWFHFKCSAPKAISATARNRRCAQNLKRNAVLRRGDRRALRALPACRSNERGKSF